MMLRIVRFRLRLSRRLRPGNPYCRETLWMRHADLLKQRGTQQRTALWGAHKGDLTYRRGVGLVPFT